MEILNNVPSQELHVVIFFFLDGVIQEVRFCVAYGFLNMSMISRTPYVIFIPLLWSTP